MSIPTKLQQALHNEQLCSHLSQTGGYNDWVVTTAFYSALHFVQDKMFPLTVAHPHTGTIVTFNNFASYYNTFRAVANKSKHAVTVSLVGIHLPIVYNNYKRLYDACMAARYDNHIVSIPLANVAINALVAIKAACVPVPVVPPVVTFGVGGTP